MTEVCSQKECQDIYTVFFFLAFKLNLLYLDGLGTEKNYDQSK